MPKQKVCPNSSFEKDLQNDTQTEGSQCSLEMLNKQFPNSSLSEKAHRKILKLFTRTIYYIHSPTLVLPRTPIRNINSKPSIRKHYSKHQLGLPVRITSSKTLQRSKPNQKHIVYTPPTTTRTQTSKTTHTKTLFKSITKITTSSPNRTTNSNPE